MTAHGVDRTGAAGGASAGSNFVDDSIITAKGDLIVGTAASEVDNLAVGTNEQRLVADSAQTTGLKYVADTTNYAIGAKGDLLVGTAADTVAAKSVGTNGKTLIADSAQSDGTLWAPLLFQPGGRLSLTTVVPVTTSDVTGATTVYYTPHKHNGVQLYDGSGWISHAFTELSQTTADNTKSPAAVANNSNYDVFVWNDSGTLRATRGPAWSSDTARGTGAGTTELEQFEGRYVNKNAITNGPAARRGLYVGTIRSDGSSQINDTATKRHVWNAYNRVQRRLAVSETADSWTYTTATVRQANGNAANQLDLVIGLSEDEVVASVVSACANSSAGVDVSVGIGLDSTTTMASGCLVPLGYTPSANNYLPLQAQWHGYPGIGRHFLAWLEYSAATGTTTWVGDAGAAIRIQCGIHGVVQA